jgi:hypothetical protein
MDAFEGPCKLLPVMKRIFHRFPFVLSPPSGIALSVEKEVMVNQVGACIIYIGDVLDYGPATSAEERVRNAVTLA